MRPVSFKKNGKEKVLKSFTREDIRFMKHQIAKNNKKGTSIWRFLTTKIKHNTENENNTNKWLLVMADAPDIYKTIKAIIK